MYTIYATNKNNEILSMLDLSNEDVVLFIPSEVYTMEREIVPDDIIQAIGYCTLDLSDRTGDNKDHTIQLQSKFIEIYKLWAGSECCDLMLGRQVL